MKKLKYISWNVNGLRACLKKGFMDAFRTLDADCFCLQETKLQPHQIELELPGYHHPSLSYFAVTSMWLMKIST